MKLAAAFAVLATLLALGAQAQAQAWRPRPHLEAAAVRTYLGCFIDSGRHLHLRNTTSTVIRLGTPVYWTGKQAGQQQPHEYRAPVYLDVAPGASYQIGGGYRYDPSVACRVWITRLPTATLAQ
jgi:hypothetical protein